MAVRLAPSLRFTYVERALLPLFLLLRPPAAAPSTLVDAMPLCEFAERAQAACALPPLVRPGFLAFPARSSCTCAAGLLAWLPSERLRPLVLPGMSQVTL